MSLDVKAYQNYKWWFLDHLSRQKLQVLINLIGIGIVTLSRVLIPILIGLIIDSVLITQNFTYFIFLLVIALIVYLIRNGMDYITMMVGHYLGFSVEQNMRQEFFDTIQHKPLSYHDKARTGDLQALATNDLRIINTMISHGSFYIYPFFQIVMAGILL
ncbi:MAG: ABC transporter transmembrane domain-containing protein, partial [Candidatus Hodarchaeota archaeon]